MNRYSAFLLVYLTILVGTSFAHAQSIEDFEDDFNEIDAQLEQSFVQTDAELEAVFDAVNQAIQAAFTGQTQNIEVKWPNDVVVPSGSTWVVYSEDYEQRVVYDFEQGFYKLEVPKSADTLRNIGKLHELYAKLKADKANAIKEMDVFKKAIISEVEQLPEVLSAEPATETTDPLENIAHSTPQAEIQSKANSEAISTNSDDTNYELIQTVTEIPSDIALETLQRELEALNAPEVKANIEAVQELAQEANIEPAKVLAPEVTGTPLTSDSAIETIDRVTQTEVSEPTVTAPSAKNFELIETDSTISLKFPFVNGYQKTLVEQRMDTITEMSKRFDVETSLVMAIIEAESSFNPMATSHIPAFGLMQLVPKTAGIDAYKFVYGEGKVVTPDYLYNIENNLKLGTAYLSLLQTRYLRGIEKPSNLLYSTIASYNTGVGNLARSVSGQKGIRKAIPAINQISDQEYFDYLQQNLPALETKRYLQKVIKNKQKYEYLD